MPSPHPNSFDKLYAEGGWNRAGSGLGSQLAYARDYIVFLENFIRYNRIRSVVDYGCGDWTFSKFVHWGDATYLGIDCAAAVVARNQSRHAGASIQFKLAEWGDFSIPPSDLLIVKDVLQHLPYAMVHRFLAAVRESRAPFVLLTNDFVKANERDIQPGEYRPINLGLPPFEQQGAVVFYFGRSPDDKVVFLLRQ